MTQPLPQSDVRVQCADALRRWISYEKRPILADTTEWRYNTQEFKGGNLENLTGNFEFNTPHAGIVTVQFQMSLYTHDFADDGVLLSFVVQSASPLAEYANLSVFTDPYTAIGESWSARTLANTFAWIVGDTCFGLCDLDINEKVD